jgi:hypothetical protein
MRMALNRLDALKEELEGIEETEEEMQSISDHVLVLENILRGAKKPVCTKLLLIWAVFNDAPESDILDHHI